MTLRRRFVAPALAAASLTLFAASSAEAFCRTNSCDTSRGDECSLDIAGCLEGGLPLEWRTSCVTFAVERSGSPLNNIHPQDFEIAIEKSFATWMEADCGGGTHPSISVSTLGEVACNKVEYNRDQGNANIYMFRDDDWTEMGENALALTTVWYDFRTGEIYDADVEVNGTNGKPGMDSDSKITNGNPEDGADLLSILTHESGHFLGLSHSPLNQQATMYRVYQPKIGNLRFLDKDDIDGICAIYPPDREAPSQNCGPRHGFSSSCRTDKSGCAASPGAPDTNTGVLVASLALISAVVRRRRQQRRTS